MKRKFSILVLIFLFSFGFVGSALAASLSFSVPTEVVNVYYNEDGTQSVDYVITFANDSGGAPIDYVDIGIPTSNYDMSSITADVQGSQLTDIASSPYVKPGVAIGLGSYTIQPGQSGTLHVYIGKVEGVLHPYTYGDIKDYVSTNFQPSYFDSAYVTGSTDLSVSFHLPPGIPTEEPIYYTPEGGWPGPDQPETALDSQNRVMYTWRSSQANTYSKYVFGAGFPAKYIPASAIVRAPAITIDWGMVVCWGAVLFFVFILGFSMYQGIVGEKKRKLKYLPPKISVEGHGIKRGLTAVEAAVLMEQSLDKVMTMILFGVIKKNAATVTTREPLELDVVKPLPDGLNGYEKDFLTAFDEKGAVRRKALQDMMVSLLKSLSEKMKGFSRKETIAYYSDIMRRAWEQVEAADTPEVKSQKYSEAMEWTMLDKDYEGRTRNVFSSGPVYVPMWWGSYDPVFRSSTMHSASGIPSGGGSGGLGKTTINLPNLPGGNFAASLVNGVQAFSAGVIGDVTSFTSGVTNKTNPVPKPSASSSGRTGGGGGRSCACACACAGCACACAGGGR